MSEPRVTYYPPPVRLDPDLLLAIDTYCEKLKVRMIQRCLKGEAEHSGQWKRFDIEDFGKEIEEELDDAHVYAAMREWRRVNG